MEAVVEASFRDGVNALGFHFLAQIIAQVAVQRAKNLVGSSECEKNALHVGRRDQIADGAAVQREEIQVSADQHIERGRIAPGNLVVVGECLDLNATVRFCFYRVPQFVEPFIQRAAGRLVVELAQLEVRRLRPAGNEQSPAGGRQAGSEFPARDLAIHKVLLGGECCFL